MTSQRLYSISETGRRLGDIGRSKVYSLVNSKHLKLVKIGRRSAINIARRALENWVESAN